MTSSTQQAVTNHCAIADRIRRFHLHLDGIQIQWPAVRRLLAFCRDDKNDECFHTRRWTAVGTSCQDAVMKPGATPPLPWLLFEPDILHWPHFTLSPDELFENPTRMSFAVVVNPTFAACTINRRR